MPAVFLSRGRLSLALYALLLAAAGSCTTETEPVANDPRCPNRFPEAGGECDAGLSCNYAEIHPCSRPFFVATCSAAGTWELDRPCLPTGEGGSGGGGGEGGNGGGGSCSDEIPGPPSVTSELSALYPPDAGSGAYVLKFSEAVAPGLQANLSWQGAGSLVGVTKAGASYLVRFTGMNPGDTATLTVDGVKDACGTPMGEPVQVEIRLRDSCHYLGQDFDLDPWDAGWSAIDNEGDGNVWALSYDLDFPFGVDNHTGGSEACATTNGIDAEPGSSWDSELHAPVVDLTGATNVVLHYRNDFNDAGAGEAWLEASSNGADWEPLTKFSDSRGPTREHVDISAYKGGPVYLRWRYVNGTGQSSWWDVDDVCIEEFTKPNCPCPAGGIVETKDQAGFSDGNGNFSTAEPTLVTLATVGQRMSVCGELEHADASGLDYYSFNVNTGVLSGPVVATVGYCIENPFEDTSTNVWLKSAPQPLAGTATARGEGSFDVQLTDGAQQFLSLKAPDGYAKARYSVTIEVKSLSTPVLIEGFEKTPFALNPSDEDPCLEWNLATETVVPFGALPTEGLYLAYFNSYDCNSGSESLVSSALNLASASSASLFFDMYHDIEYPSSLDNIQVEYEDGVNWIPVGPKVVRPAATNGWETHTIDLTPIAGKSSVRIRLKATTEYGTNVHIDNVVLLAN